jgi:hypothetical protein
MHSFTKMDYHWNLAVTIFGPTEAGVFGMKTTVQIFGNPDDGMNESGVNIYE